MGTRLSKKEMDQIREAVGREFPNDPALQQVHIARKIISAKANREGLTFFEYIKTHQGEVAHAGSTPGVKASLKSRHRPKGLAHSDSAKR